MYSVTFKPQADKALAKLPSDTQRRIIRKLEFYLQQENPLLFAEKLINAQYGTYRFRIGDYRVIFDLENSEIVILLIGHRRDIYR